MTRPHILVLGGRDSSVVPLEPLGVDVTLFQFPDKVTTAQIGAARRSFLFDADNGEAVTHFARALHERQRVDAAVSFFETCLLPTAEMAAALGIAANPVHPVAVTRDKLKMREVLLGSGIGSARFQRCATIADLSRFQQEAGGRPVILKPSAGSGSAGVVLVRSAADLEAAWQWASAAGLSPLIAEEYLDGPEYSVESLSLSGRHQIVAITEKVTSGPPHFLELGHRLPAPLAPAVEGEIRQVVTAFLDRIRQWHGPAHTELRLVDGQVAVVESQTRFGGDQIWEMVQLVTGVSFVTSTVCHLLGRPAPAAAAVAGGAAIRFFAEPPGVLTSISGLEEARAVAGVVRVACTVAPGATLAPVRSSRFRQGYVLAVGRDAAEAAERAQAAHALVRFQIRAAEEPPEVKQ
jgi:biotin carboxylase